mmetsp:Transcript_32003/g.75014  ORF Transcript_32003/g.75014 Transcript_32003/m.75014 type:complete len:199 (+) Transcript_32003:85-681(+)
MVSDCWKTLTLLPRLLVSVVLLVQFACVDAATIRAQKFYELEATDIDGKLVSFGNFWKTRRVVITNVASECGFTSSHYADYKYMQARHPDTKIIAFPCNQFGAQEPGSSAEIKDFAAGQGLILDGAAASFVLMDKINVNGAEAHPVYSFLKSATNTGDIGWNFLTKFVIECKREECEVDRYDTDEVPSSLLEGHSQEL